MDRFTGSAVKATGRRFVPRPTESATSFGAMTVARVRGGLGTAIVSTSEGIMTGVQARKKNLGGELLCFVW